jgi:hypothetical protein
MGQERLHSPVSEQHLRPPHASRRGVALLRGRKVFPDLSGEAGERGHGAKNGVLM